MLRDELSAVAGVGDRPGAGLAAALVTQMLVS